MLIQRRDHLGEMNRAFGDFGTESIGRADHLPGADATTGEYSAAHLRPVITTGVGIDPRCATEFAPRTDHDIICQTTSMQVLDQC